jgi:hypothetical protein
MADREWKVGDYAMSKGMPIRVNDIDGLSITLELVADYRSGTGITCGGYCSGGGQFRDLTPITDPEMLLRCRAYEARRRIDAAKREISEQEKVLAAQTAGLRALQDAREATHG